MLNQGSDQAEGLRRVLSRQVLLATPRVLAVIGAPGSGKTTCAINLGAAFAARGIPMRCVDQGEAGAGVDDGDGEEALLVLTPGIDAITRAYALAKRETLEQGRRRFAVLVNRARDSVSARAVYENIASAARRFLGTGMNYAGCVRDDPALWRGPRELMEYAPDALAVADFVHVARTLAGAQDTQTSAPREPWTDPFYGLFHQRRSA